LDLHASFREIWQGAEQWSSGKEADPAEHVTLDLDSPASGNAAGIVFSPVEGKGCKDPIAAAPTNKTTGAKLELAPLSPLARGCTYEFVVPETTQLTTNGGHLTAPLRVPFRVCESNLTPALRELEHVQSDPDTRTLKVFSSRAGLNTPVREALERYEDAIGVPAAELEQSITPSAETGPISWHLYVQHHGAYVVPGFGYLIRAENGFFRDALGKVMPKLPAFGVPRLSETEALKRATNALALAPPPWDAPGNHFQRPRGLLELIQDPTNAAGAGFVPVWGFRFDGSGYTALSSIEIDVQTGKVVARDAFHIVE
jgi:hypothetical protein